jgi:hypothetical protein
MAFHGSLKLRRFDMSAKIKSEAISRRSALSLLGLAALSLAVPATVLTVSETEAQQAAPPPPTAPQSGMERRHERRKHRRERRHERRKHRMERRQARRKHRVERREERRKGSEEKK